MSTMGEMDTDDMVKVVFKLKKDEDDYACLRDCYSPRSFPVSSCARGVLHSLPRVLVLMTLSCIALHGCMANYGQVRDILHPAYATPSPGAKPAAGRWQGHWKMDSVGSNLRATFYYGPWQCNQRWMNSCQRECAAEGHMLKGCMWLADIKYDWQAPVMPITAGSRYALWHCCCDFPTLSPAQKKPLRNQWEAKRDSLRKKWGEIYGEWPKSGGVNWPGHHIVDLFHGGDPTDLGNILPVQPGIHDVLNEQYPKCYEGNAPWDEVGPDLPYTD